jgi:hypothetical protein
MSQRLAFTLSVLPPQCKSAIFGLHHGAAFAHFFCFVCS